MRDIHILLIAAFGGISIGVGAILLKIFLTSFNLVVGVIMLAPGISGFLLVQYALKHNKMHTVAALAAGTSSVTASIGGILLLEEVLVTREIIGIILIILGIILVYRHGLSESYI